MTQEPQTINITVLLAAGRLPLEIMQEAHRIAGELGLEVYLTTAQNLRLLAVPKEQAEAVKERLAKLGADFKAPGKFLLPKVCVGMPHCNLATIDTKELSTKILSKFDLGKKYKGKVKIGLSGCALCCSGAKTTDIGVIASRKGFDIYVGGKVGPNPKEGRLIKTQVGEEEVIQTIETLISFHDSKTEKKQRLFKLLDDPEFPFQEIE